MTTVDEGTVWGSPHEVTLDEMVLHRHECAGCGRELDAGEVVVRSYGPAEAEGRPRGAQRQWHVNVAGCLRADLVCVCGHTLVHHRDTLPRRCEVITGDGTRCLCTAPSPGPRHEKAPG